MSTKSDAGMQVLYARVCGWMCIRRRWWRVCMFSMQRVVRSTVRRFGTITSDLMELRSGLFEAEVRHEAMESTGVFWQPVFNLLEGYFQLWLVNAQHIKKVPGRRTDVKDAEWNFAAVASGLWARAWCPSVGSGSCAT
jgi:transposase